jgi:hypothetical protein
MEQAADGANNSMRTIVVAIVWLLLAAVPGRAAVVDPNNPVPGHPGLTYFDLIKQIVTDLPQPGAGGEPTAHQIAAYRHIEGADAKTEPAGPVAIQYFSPLEINAGGARRLLVLVDLGESDMAVAEFVLLGLFDLASKPKLLDVVEVGTDHLTGFADRPLRALGHGTDLIVVHSEHFDASMDYVNTELLFVRNDRFALAATVATTGYLSCSYRFEERPIIETRPGQPYKQILFAVRETLRWQPDHAACDEGKLRRPFAHRFLSTFRWNTRRQAFVTRSHAFRQLERLNTRLNTTGPPWER